MLQLRTAVQALSKVFRGKFMAALIRAHHQGDITNEPPGDSNAWCERLRQLYKYDWVVYAKTPLGGPAQVLEYLSRYTHTAQPSAMNAFGPSPRKR